MKKVFLILFVFAIASVFAQQQNLPLNREFNLVNQKVFNAEYSETHTSFQPIIQSQIKLRESRTLGLGVGEADYYLTNVKKDEKRDRSWITRKLFYENFLIVDTGNFYLTVDPLLNGEIGNDTEDNTGKTLYKNTRGLIVRANVGEKFSFETSVYENQMVVPSYLDNYVLSNGAYRVLGVMPGQGRVKRFKDNGYDFAISSAIVTYAPAEFLTLQMGTGKHHVGDGYRSLLLSDYSFNYPFFKAITTFGKKNQFQYTKLNASLSTVVRRELTATPEPLFKRKSMSTHYFSWLATKWLNIGLFESTLWKTETDTSTRPFQFQQLNPVIGVNTATTGFNDANHSIVGSNIKITLPFKTILYNQFVYDGSNRFGYQGGIKYFGVNGLTLQAEFNSVEAGTYASYVDPLQSYTNYNEPLAHPLGNDFQEIIGIINYKYKRAFTEYRVGLRTQNSFNSMVAEGHIGYLINPKNNLAAMIGVTERVFEGNRQAVYLNFGIKTNLRNLYNDF